MAHTTNVFIRKVNTWLTAVFTFVCITAVGSNDNWQLYPSYNEISEIEPTGSDTYVLASGCLFSYNLTDGSIRTFNKINALSDNTISHITWVKATKRLVIIYENSNIDLLSADGTTLNVPDLYMKSMTDDKSVNSIYISNATAYLATQFGIVKLNTDNGSIADTYQLGFNVNFCYIEGDYIYASSMQQGTYRANLTTNLLDKSNWTRVSDYVDKSTDHTNVYDSTTKYWWTKTTDGKLTYYTTNDSGERTYMTEGVKPDGPSSNNFYHIYINNGNLYATGGIWNQGMDGQRDGEVHVWNGTQWSEFNKPSDNQYRDLFNNALCLDFDPRDNNHVMVGTKNGLFEYRSGNCVNLYNIKNSPLISANGSEILTYTVITSVKYDAEGNLWTLNPSNKPIKCLKTDGQWVEINHNLSVADLEKAFISKYNGMMWFVNNWYDQCYLYAYDYINDNIYSYGPTITNQDGGTVSATHFYSTNEDREGNIWVATDVGPLYLAASTISNGDNYFTQYKVPRNDGTNLADYLLSSVSVLSIAVDGGNRKWFGTNGNGVFLISADNNTQVEHFTTSNSPLPSDIVQDIVINNATGEVFFATDKGLCSYKSDSTEPSEEMTKDNVYAYPNPVKPDYTGPITIVGLTYNADVKIVTSNGVLVNKGQSTGGSYTWDGTDLKGRRVVSGVYMVQTATQDGEKGTVCKIAVVN